MSTAVTPVTPAAPATMFDPSKVFAMWCSYGDLERLSVKDKARVVGLLQKQVEPLADHIGETITIEHLVVHNVEMADEDGVAFEAARLVLVQPDGTAFGCVSEGARRSVGLLAQFYGMPPWKGGIKAKIEQVTTRRGFRTFILTPVE